MASFDSRSRGPVPLISLAVFLSITTTLATICGVTAGASMEKIIYTEAFHMAPGAVAKAWYDAAEFPKGHVGIQSVAAELVDENYEPVPLSEAYLHHWVLRTFYEGEPEPTDASGTGNNDDGKGQLSGVRGIPVTRGHERSSFSAAGAASSASNEEELSCDAALQTDIGIYFGLGSETRQTNTTYPAPYAVEFDPSFTRNIWKSQVHAIDLRGTQDPWGCLECLCDLYDTDGISALGEPLADDYIGGYLCCYSGKTCKVKEASKNLPVLTRYLKIKIQYVIWDECSVVPLKVYFLDVAGCRGEYDVPTCQPHNEIASCVHKKSRDFIFPKDGHMVFAEGHLHYGSIGNRLTRKNGEVVCDSLPKFGRGGSADAGHEAGFLTGMGTCVNPNKEVSVKAGETIRMESVYSRLGGHTGVMGQFIVYVAELADQKSFTSARCSGSSGLPAVSGSLVQDKEVSSAYDMLTILKVTGGVAAVVSVMSVLLLVGFRKRQQGQYGDFRPLPESA